MDSLMVTNPALGIVLGIFGLVMYFLPAIIANQRKHKQYQPILLINLFLGWTVIFWLVALIWAFSHQEAKTA